MGKLMLFTMLTALLLGGCATNPDVAKSVAQANASIAAIPTLTINCTTGCSAQFTDPRDRQHVDMPKNGADVAMSISHDVFGVLGAAVVPYAMGYTAVKGMQALKGSGQVTTTTTTTTSTTNTDSHAVDSHSIDSHTVDSHTVDSHAATAPPTVVNQPAPIIVTP